jgi:hypothetical protein
MDMFLYGWSILKKLKLGDKCYTSGAARNDTVLIELVNLMRQPQKGDPRCFALPKTDG